MQGSNGDTDMENRLADTVEMGEGGMNRERSMKNTHYHMQNRELVGICHMMQGAQIRCSLIT